MIAAALSRISAIARKEFIHIRRDPRMLIAVLIVPIVQLLLFSYAISFDVKNVPTVVLDQDKTAASRAYLQTYRSSDFFAVKGSIRRPRRRRRGVPAQPRADRRRGAARVRALARPRREGAGRGPGRRHRAERRAARAGVRHRAQPGLRQRDARRVGRPAGPRHHAARPARTARAHLVQPRAQVGGLPDPGPDGGHHHDRHGPADRGDARARAGPGHAGADDGEPAAPARADARASCCRGRCSRSST